MEKLIHLNKMPIIDQLKDESIDKTVCAVWKTPQESLGECNTSSVQVGSFINLDPKSSQSSESGTESLANKLNR